MSKNELFFEENEYQNAKRINEDSLETKKYLSRIKRTKNRLKSQAISLPTDRHFDKLAQKFLQKKFPFSKMKALLDKNNRNTTI